VVDAFVILGEDSETVKLTLNLFLTALLLTLWAELHAADGPSSPSTFEERAKATMEAATVDLSQLKGTSPMHFWVAQRLFESGKTD